MRYSLALVGLAMALPAAAQEPTTTSDEFFPLIAGAKWTYKVSGQPERFTVRAVRQEMVGGQTCMLMEASLSDKVVATEHLAFAKDGLYRYRADKEDVNPPVCILRLPATRGERWKSEFKLGARSASASFSIGAIANVDVPAGKYKVIPVTASIFDGQGPRPSTSTTVSYAEGVGIVRQVIEDGGKRPSLILELEKFETSGKR